ncbi:cytochrome P450 [Mycolicibacterium smegmatis]|uniref:cytochrome P450 n=1 Tax=Mycolicibacterium smegmatis TaxID=1772 RepID=UPI0012FF9B62|nr:cytochrome P450 [Mycolicibacterium smegmatis]MDF1903799.1 cytochrome P450 [Mycolicibacterium smegmatis]MDF1910360.1 cytochrome P450 [Mycolicibacterium smegmatis]MDF1922115.1 cytochrome P450 [Mycolicibacterium smegmatis]MDF1928688.1 cytochrome P450 [Mycolicibacterium smegmatis]UAK52864.1 cytochrome P450 [Mycolicibacterium smegmatis]
MTSITPPHESRSSTGLPAMPDQTELLPFYHPELLDKPYPHFRRLRDEFPVLRLDDGTYVLSRYEDVSAALRHTVSSVQQVDFGAFDILHSSLVGMDAPAHTFHRRLVNSHFTPKSIRNWMATTASVVHQALSASKPSGQVEAVRELCVVPTYATTCAILGIPAEHADEVRYYTYQFARGFGLVASEDDLRAGAEGSEWLTNHCDEVIERAHREARAGVVATYLAVEERGEITRREVTANVLLFLAAGQFSPANLAAHGLERMASDPELFAAFRDDAAVRPKVVNELLRFVTPEVGVTRLLLEDLDASGTVIPAGTTVYVLLASANRDERVFPDPDRFDYHRSVQGSPHLAFAAGLHACMGQVLARQETEAILTAVVDRCARIELIGKPEYNSIQHARQWRTMDLQLTF